MPYKILLSCIVLCTLTIVSVQAGASDVCGTFPDVRWQVSNDDPQQRQHLITFGMYLQLAHVLRPPANWFYTSVSYCDWERVYCTETQQICGIDLSQLNIAGYLPPGFGTRGEFPELQYFDLSRNKLSEPIPATIGNFPKLKVLALSYNNFIGTIPESLYTLSELTELNLDYNKLNGALSPHIGNLSQLRFLKLTANLLMGAIPDSIGNLTQLRVLEIDRCQFTAFPETIGSLQSLQRLIAPYNNFRYIPKSFSALSNLQIVYLESNEISMDLSELMEHHLPHTASLYSLTLYRNFIYGSFNPNFGLYFPSLEIFDIAYNQIIGPIPHSIGRLTHLTTLRLQANRIEGELPQSICQLTLLSRLQIGDNRINGSIPECIGQLTRLTHLNLERNRLEGSVPQSISMLQLLQGLSLSKNRLTSFPDILQSPLLQLRSLLISDNKLSQQFPSSICLFANLETLDLSKNELVGQIPPLITGLSLLKTLDVSNNQLEGTFSSNLKMLYSLKELNIAHNKFSGPIPDDFNIHSLAVFNISHNQFNGSIPWELGYGLKVLDISHNRFNGLMQLSGFAAIFIQHFDASYNQFSGPIPNTLIYWLSTATYLNLASNNFTGDIPAAIGSIISLKYLNIANNQLEGYILQRVHLLSSLDYLNVSSNRFTGNLDEYVPLFVTNRLQVFDLSHNAFVTYDMNALFGNFTQFMNLKTLDLSGNPLNSTLPDIPLPLTNLALEGCGLIGEYPTSWTTKMSQLQTLNLANNKLNGNIPSFDNIVSLQSLKLNGNQFSGRVSRISQSALSHIDLSANELEGDVPVISSNKLQYIDLSHNRFSGIVPHMQLNALQLTRFDLSNNRIEGVAFEFDIPFERRLSRNVSAANEKYPLPTTNEELMIGGGSSGDGGKLPMEEQWCFMGDNNLQCHLMPQSMWPVHQCGATCVYDGYIALVVSLSGTAVVLLVIVTVASVVLALRLRLWLVRKRNQDSYLSLEKSVLSTALHSVQDDLLIPWKDIRFISRLGEGAFGVVYHGVWKSTEVAVKSFKSTTDESTVRELITEIRLLMKLKHPHVVMLMGACIEQSHLAIVLEYMSKGSLYHVLHEHKETLSWSQRLNLTFQIASGMLFLHLQQPPVLHRDLKSLNVLIDRNYTAKITDFGFSKEKSGQSKMTLLIGSIQYMAPELFEDDTNACSNITTFNSNSSYNSNNSNINNSSNSYAAAAALSHTSEYQPPVIGSSTTTQRKLHNSTRANSMKPGSSEASELKESLLLADFSATEVQSDEQNLGYGTAVDVYAFGILMWEIYTQQIPWDGLQQSGIMARVITGQRPPIPALSQEPLDEATTSTTPMNDAEYQQRLQYLKLMQQCWRQMPRERPSFAEIVQELKLISAL